MQEALPCIGQDSAAKTNRGRHPDAACHTAKSGFEPLYGLPQGMNQGAALFVILRTLRGDLHAPRTSVEQTTPKLLLEVAQAAGDSCSGQLQFMGRRARTTLLDYRHKQIKIIEHDFKFGI